MRKDIIIPKVEGVYVAVVNQYNTIYKTLEWNAYIINEKNTALDTVIIVSEGLSKTKKTATFRKRIDKLPAKSYAKIELMREELFALTNSFKISFFEGNTMFDKTYIFKKNTINVNALQVLPVMNVKGVLVK